MDLKFDEMTVDTSLAQEYIKKNKYLSELCKSNIYKSSNDPSTVIVFDGKEFCEKLPKDLQYLNQPHVIPGNLQDLASLLKQNASLISQLEYYTRSISIEDTNAQLNLIIKYLKCEAPTNGFIFDVAFQLVKFYSNEPLLFFGFMVDILMYSRTSVTLTNMSNKTVAICHLFFKLFHEAGFKNLIVKFAYDAPNDTTRPSTEDPPTTEGEVPLGLDSGTVAIISEDADVDSAVDTLLSASEQAPWRLRRILVQESIYQQFKDALSWKCNLKKYGIYLPSNLLCAEALTYNGRVFLIDPVASSEDQLSVVTIEAYRTRKEMISLVQKDKTRYLSLWANDIAEINEVTHTTKTPVIWVNNLADFRGPPQIAEAVYSYVLDNYTLIKKCQKITKLCELSQSWAKLDIETRREILYIALDKCILSDPKNEKVYTEIRNSLSKYTLKSFVDVGKDYICVGMTNPAGVKGIKKEQFFSVDIFKSILYGNAFAILTENVRNINETNSEFDILVQASVPVGYTFTESFYGGDLLIPQRVEDTRTRVIWTNSGTIFAN